MDFSTQVLLGVVAILAMNHLVMRIGALQARAAVFWTVQAINVAVGSAVLLLGLPGLEHVPPASWLVGLLFFFRVLINTNMRANWLREKVQADRAARRRKEQALRDALGEEAE